MKKIILFLYCIFSISLINSAFLDNTMVNTPKGLIALPSLKVGDTVVCFKDDKTVTHKKITAVHKRKVDDLFKVTTHDGAVVHCCKDAQFYMPKTKDWQIVSKLTSKNWLLRQDLCGTKVKSVEKVSKPTDVFCITVDDCSNFYVSEEGILVHNEPMTITVCSIAWGTGGGATIVFFEGAGVAIGSALLTWFGYSVFKEVTGVEVQQGTKTNAKPVINSSDPLHGCPVYIVSATAGSNNSSSGHVDQRQSVLQKEAEQRKAVLENTKQFISTEQEKGATQGGGTQSVTPSVIEAPMHTIGINTVHKVENDTSGINGMSINPPDDHIIHTPVPGSQGPSVISDPIPELLGPSVIKDPIPETQKPPVVIDPIPGPLGPTILADPIPQKFDYPIMTQTPEQEAIGKILEGAERGKESGETTQYGKPGGFEGVLDDFEKIKKLFPGSEVRDLGDGKSMITLPDGTKIIARPTSSGKVPTLEIQNIPGAQRDIKIRYNKSARADKFMPLLQQKSDVEIVNDLGGIQLDYDKQIQRRTKVLKNQINGSDVKINNNQKRTFIISDPAPKTFGAKAIDFVNSHAKKLDKITPYLSCGLMFYRQYNSFAEAEKYMREKWDIKNPLYIDGQDDLNDIIAYNNIRLTEKQRRMVGEHYDLAKILSVKEWAKYGSYVKSLPDMAREDRVINVTRKDALQYIVHEDSDFSNNFNGLQDILELREKRKFLMMNEAQPKDVAELKKKVDLEYVISKKYLNREHQKNFDTLLTANQIKLSDKDKLRLERQCAVNLQANPDYFKEWVFDLNSDNKTLNADIIKNIDDVWKSRRKRSLNSLLAKKYITSLDGEKIFYLGELQKTREELYKDTKKNAEILVKHKQSINGAYTNEKYAKKIDDLIKLGQIKITDNRKLKLTKQLAMNCHISPQYKEAFEQYDVDINVGKFPYNMHGINDINDLFIATHKLYLKEREKKGEYWPEIEHKFKKADILEYPQDSILEYAVDGMIRQRESKHKQESQNHDFKRSKL